MPQLILSNPTQADLVIYKGDSGRFRITFVPQEGEDPIDISEATWDGDIRARPSDEAVITSFDIVPVDGDVSSVDVILSHEKSELLPNNCVYDVEMRAGDEVSTIIYGGVTVMQDVSRPAAP